MFLPSGSSTRLKQATPFTGSLPGRPRTGNLETVQQEASLIVTNQRKKQKVLLGSNELINTKAFVIDSLFLIFPFHTKLFSESNYFPFLKQFSHFLK